MLPHDEWLHFAEQVPAGEKRHFEHLCGPGKKLLIENKPEGYSAWCYRCSEKGWKPHPEPSLKERIAKLTAQRAEDRRTEAMQAPPVPTHFNPQEWPQEARVWLYKAGLSNERIMQHGFYYTEKLNRVVLPILEGGEVIYWQARGFDPDRAKYLNPAGEKPLAKYGEAGPVVLTEDILSAARVGEVAKGWAILGTALTDRAAAQILTEAGGTPVRIWLDGDAAGRKGRRNVLQQLSLAGATCRLIKTDKDPKEYSRTEIEQQVQT